MCKCQWLIKFKDEEARKGGERDKGKKEGGDEGKGENEGGDKFTLKPINMLTGP